MTFIILHTRENDRENTTGYNGSDNGNENRQQLAFEALKTWVIQNYNTTFSGGDKAYIYTSTTSSSKMEQIWGYIIANPNNF